MVLPKFITDKHGNRVAYVKGTFAGYIIHSNGGNMFGWDVVQDGRVITTVYNLDTAKDIVRGRIAKGK